MIKLFNTLSREKETLRPLEQGQVGLYTCGPTVYNFAHIGNLRTYIFEDVLQRTLKYDGLKVKRVMNVTDVGHLTSDKDTGEDKLDKEARIEKKGVGEIAAFYTNAFLEDLKKLNVKIPEIIAPATEFIQEQQELIKKLFEKGLAYETAAAVYFSVQKYGPEKYRKLSQQPLDQKISGAREEVVIDPEKKYQADFVLWFKLAGKFKNHILRWPSPWSEGFPGWHIECSAIATHFLGQPFDIHTGGVDHIGTHHTNEIAQSEGATGLPLANIWLHGEFLLIDRGKMAKSEGNFFTLENIVQRGFNPLAFRYLTLETHYRTPLNFSWESLTAAQNGLRNLYEDVYLASRLAHQSKTVTSGNDAEKCKKMFAEAINDDLNAPKALGLFRDRLRANDISPENKLLLAKKFDKVLGLRLEIPMNFRQKPEISSKISDYWKFRENKQFVQSDALRKKLEQLGFIVRDAATGPIVTPKFF